MRSLLFVFFCLLMIPANAQSITANDIRTVQQLLKDDGYNTGTVDASFGPRTSAAIKLYQSDWKLPRTGKISAGLIDHLTGKHQDTLPRWQKTGNQDCSVYNPYPRARETVNWQGDCQDGKAHGQGKVEYQYFAQGKKISDSFEGTLTAGRISGQGVYVWANGDQYQGHWSENQSDGLGIYNWADGRRYAGYWQQDRAHGQGTYREPDGTAYVGEFSNGCFYNGVSEISVNTSREECSVE